MITSMVNDSIMYFQMHVDVTLPLWAFWDIYGNTSKICLIGSTKEPVIRFNVSSAPLNSSGMMPPASNQEQLPARNNNNRTRELERSPQSILHNNIPDLSAACPVSVACPPTTNTQNAVNSKIPTDNLLNTSFGSNSGPSECTLCFEKVIDCVLYTCGHMCMCYDCAIHQWKRGGGFCPFCRNDIRDVIRTFRS